MLLGFGLPIVLFELRPRVCPPGFAWRSEDTWAYAALLLGSLVAARGNRAWVPQLVYGLLVAAPFPFVSDLDFGGDSSVTAGDIARHLLLMAATGLLCVVIAKGTQRFCHPRNPDPTRCRKCGYLLQGLPEPRCPECGTRFDADPPLHSAP